MMIAGNGLQDSLIMMVDDEPIMIELIRIFLEENGYQHFVGVSDSTQAIKTIQDMNPDIILLDLVMPDVSGFEVLQEIRRSDASKHMPVIVLTSSSDAQTKLKALEYGATDFLAKPVDQSELALRLRNSLSFKVYQDQLAYYDSLTGLPNRRLYLERLTRKLRHAASSADQQIAVVSVRIGHYRKINETYGPRMGEALIRAASARLLEFLRNTDLSSLADVTDPVNVFAHVASDEFAILLESSIPAPDAISLAERLMKKFTRALVVEEQEFFIPIQIGIASSATDGVDPELLLTKASSAADALVSQQEAGYRFYSEDANQGLKEKLELNQDLRKALGLGQFHLVYQPQVNGTSGVIQGAEALLRWVHPEKGFISPAEFIPLAEESDLMIDIGAFVLKEACVQAVSWAKQGLGHISVSVNISGRQFKHDDFLNMVKYILSETGANPKQIMIEITESLAMTNVTHAIQLLQDLRQLGLEVSVDDFGTGYSSLSYLKDFPIDELKIDKAFIDGLPDNRGDQAIVSAIITMAKQLGFKIVAEGVEEPDQVTYLNSLGCDLIQGYYFSRPLNTDDFIQYALSHL